MTAKKKNRHLFKKFILWSLDYIAKQRWILRNLNAKFVQILIEKLMYYDLTQQLLILKHFLVKVIKPGYSKDGKFKEPDCYRYGNWWKWDTVTLQNISRKCYWFKYFLPFMLEIADIYEVNSVTIIADKGWVLIEILDFWI